MRKTTAGLQTNNITAVDMNAALASSISAHATRAGETRTVVPGLSLFRNPGATVCNITSVEPGITFFAQGEKKISIRGTDYVCGPGSFLVASVELPIRSQITKASQDVPQLAIRLLLDMTSVREVANREDLPEVQGSSERRGLALGQTTAGLLSAALRLLELLEAPEDIPFLKPLLERELIIASCRRHRGSAYVRS